MACAKAETENCGLTFCLPKGATFLQVQPWGQNTTIYSVSSAGQTIIIHEGLGFRNHYSPETPLSLPIDSKASWGIDEGGQAYVKIKPPSGRFIELYADCATQEDCHLPNFASRLSAKTL